MNPGGAPLLHLHRLARLRGLVDRADGGDGIARVAAGDGGLALFADGVAEVFELEAVAFGADGHGICHAAADSGGAAACTDRVVAGLLIFKLPKLDRVVLDDDGALVAAQLDALVPAGVPDERLRVWMKSVT